MPVTFEVERFEWTSRDRLEVVGRWFGLRGHRFLRPTLDVEVDGERRRMLAVLEHKPWAPEEGEDWVAAFTWKGAPANFDDAELTVSPDLAVHLPVPDGSLEEVEATAATPAADRLPARRPRTVLLEGELATAIAEVERLNEELVRVRAAHAAGVEDLRGRLNAEQAKIRGLEAKLEQAREHIATSAAAAAAEVEGLRQERDAAAAASDAALGEATEARGDRDAVLQKLAAAEGERVALAEARDRARQERNAWMSRARAVAARHRGGAPTPEPSAAPEPEPAIERLAESASEPEPRPEAEPGPATAPAERRTIRIGERTAHVTPASVSPVPGGGLRPFLEEWAPRLVALLALAVFVVVLILLLT